MPRMGVPDRASGASPRGDQHRREPSDQVVTLRARAPYIALLGSRLRTTEPGQASQARCASYVFELTSSATSRLQRRTRGSDARLANPLFLIQRRRVRGILPSYIRLVSNARLVSGARH